MHFQDDIRDGQTTSRLLSEAPRSEVLVQDTISDFCTVWNDANRARSATVKALFLKAEAYMFDRIRTKRPASGIVSTLAK
jgi:hypothetical protein